MKIAVAGGTGRLGRRVVEVGLERGHDMVAMSRATGVDVITGDGLEEALAGVDVIVDAATGSSPEQQAATEFFETAAHTLQEAAQRTGVQRAVVVSIIGTDKFEGGYGVAQVAHENAWRDGRVPARVVRAAQFHELVGQLLEWGDQGEVAVVPELSTQVVAARTVAEVLVDVATSPDFDADELVEVAGPRRESMVELATLLAAAAARRRRSSPCSTPTTTTPGCRPAVACCRGRTPFSAGRRSRPGSTSSDPAVTARRRRPPTRSARAVTPSLARSPR